jgi:phytoene desaturase
MKQKKAIIIGAGVGGLATAIRLANKGFEVDVFEKNNFPGGKASSIEKNGYFWGFGPSLFTFPELLDELFKECGKNPEDYYSYYRLDPICNYFFPNGKRLSTFAEPQKFAEEAEQKLGEPQKNVLTHLYKINELYELTKEMFLFSSLHKLKTYTKWNALKTLMQLSKIGLTETVHKVNSKRFQTAEMIQLFDRYPTYNGSNPYKSPSTLNVIASPEFNKGGYILKGGMPTLSKSLFKLAEELGVSFHFGEQAELITVQTDEAKSVTVNGKVHDADIVVSNMDIYYTYHNLIKKQLKHPSVVEYPMSTSALIFSWGIKKTFEELDCHNIFFSENYEEEFRCIENKTISNDPTIYVFISKKYNPSHAPDGCENWFTLVNVPPNTGQNWDELIAKTRKNIISKISKSLGTTIEPLIECETITDPRAINERTLSYQGAIYGISSNSQMAAFLRHPNFSRKVDNLFFTGGSVHPGGGVPLCLLSAKIIDEIIHE